MKLLVPVDGSAASLKASKKAAEIAKKDGYDVKMITVVKPEDLRVFKRYAKIWENSGGSMFDPAINPVDEDEAMRRLKNNAEELLDSVADESKLNEVKLEKVVLFGEPYEKIIETAKNENCDMIVMGNRGFSKIERFFIGSVAQRVISEASCPVLVIHSDVRD